MQRKGFGEDQKTTCHTTSPLHYMRHVHLLAGAFAAPHHANASHAVSLRM
jgi:hypothetical protein